MGPLGAVQTEGNQLTIWTKSNFGYCSDFGSVLSLFRELMTSKIEAEYTISRNIQDLVVLQSERLSPILNSVPNHRLHILTK
jgi:hypothetical protein